MTNYEKWLLLNKDSTAPQSYVDWCFYYLIAACLQRRIWVGAEDHRPLFSNIYVTLVGPPAAGKGLAIDPVSEILRYHKLQRANHSNGEITPESMKREAEVEAMLAEQPELQKAFNRQRKELKEEHLLFPIGANATTFESLAETIAASIRRINYMRYDKALAKEVRDTYCHCSLAFVLTELSSLFKRQSENIVNLITDMYDCKPYTYKTKTKGTDHIAKGCLNFLAGTTLSYMEEVFSDRIINEGYASRTFFVVESGPRGYKWDIGQLSDEQHQAKRDLIAYAKRLSGVYGECHFSPEADAFLKDWWERDRARVITNHDSKLEPYYGRKNIHEKKMAMILHASEADTIFLEPEGAKCNMEISLATAQRALGVLEAVEKKMHMALSFGSSNALFKPARQALKIIDKAGDRGICYKDLQFAMWEYMPDHDISGGLRTIVEHLTGSEKIVGEENPREELRSKGLVYKIAKPPEETPTDVPLTESPPT